MNNPTLKKISDQLDKVISDIGVVEPFGDFPW